MTVNTNYQVYEGEHKLTQWIEEKLLTDPRFIRMWFSTENNNGVRQYTMVCPTENNHGILTYAEIYHILINEPLDDYVDNATEEFNSEGEEFDPEIYDFSD